jgi:DNA-binding MarR family transcriptional regulator
MIDGEAIKTRADLARHLGVSRARVTQVLGPMSREGRR